MALKSRKPSREARRLARRMSGPRLVPHRTAAAWTQIQDLAKALRMKIPASAGAAGRRMRLGPETRALLKRVRNSRTIREAQAWMREVAHQVAKRARIHDRRRRIAAKARTRTAKAGRGLRNRVRPPRPAAVPVRVPPPAPSRVPPPAPGIRFTRTRPAKPARTGP